ncbi:dentin sialophosphoprotein isoform X2 [Capsella rubella]|uniref:dentin sialophosphoprotein isoform X2 n=1 Tax=Capsella rubella TaxID=81985 RepID=UPI000CD5B6AB|nr:dentin sialophosphoprotein isoform X2 [Capsella rubella]
MEPVTVSDIGNSNDCQKNPELSDKQKERSGKKKRKSRKQESELKNIESHISSQNGNADGKTEKSTSEDQVQLSENRVSTLPAATLHHTDSILSTREESLPDANKNGSSRKKSKRRERKKKEDSSCEEKMLDDVEKITNEYQVHPPNTLSNSVASVVINSCLQSKDDTVEKQECSDVKYSETVAQDQSPKPKKRKKRKNKTAEVCDPLGDTLPTSTKSGSVECVENDDGNKETDGNTEVKEHVLEVKYNTTSQAEGSQPKSIEEKSIASVVISSCPKSKDDTVEQQECTDVKLSETVAQSQSPKAKRKKKRKTKTVEVCDPLGNSLPTSTKSGSVECVENNDGNGGIISYSATHRENSVTGKVSGLQNLGKTKEKETDENNGVKEDVLGAGVCDLRSKKQKGKKNKTASADHKTADMEVPEPSGSVECLLDHSEGKDMQNCDGNAGLQFGGEDMTSKTEKSVTREKSGVQKSGKRKEMTKDENIESNQDMFGEEGVSDVPRKRHKRKIKKEKNCESVATMDSDSLLYQSNREGVEICDGEIASMDMASNIEDSATKKEIVQDVKISKKKKKDKKEEVVQDAFGVEDDSKVEVTTKKRKKKKNSIDHETDNMEDDSKKIKDEKGEVDQNALGAEGASKVEVKTKKSKKKNSLDHKTDDMDEKDDVSLIRKDEEPEVDREKLQASLSSSVLVQNNKAQGVSSSETSEPRCSCEGRTRKLVVFDLNGILGDIVQGFTGQFIPDGKVSYRSVFRRPFLSSFLDFCFERFHVAIWSSRRIGLDYMVGILMRNYARNLLFCFSSYVHRIRINAQQRSLKLRRRTINLCSSRIYEQYGTVLGHASVVESESTMRQTLC